MDRKLRLIGSVMFRQIKSMRDLELRGRGGTNQMSFVYVELTYYYIALYNLRSAISCIWMLKSELKGVFGHYQIRYVFFKDIAKEGV